MDFNFFEIWDDEFSLSFFSCMMSRTREYMYFDLIEVEFGCCSDLEGSDVSKRKLGILISFSFPFLLLPFVLFFN